MTIWRQGIVDISNLLAGVEPVSSDDREAISLYSLILTILDYLEAFHGADDDLHFHSIYALTDHLSARVQPTSTDPEVARLNAALKIFTWSLQKMVLTYTV